MTRTLWGVGIDWANRFILVQLGELTVGFTVDAARSLSQALLDGSRALAAGQPFRWSHRGAPDEAAFVVTWEGEDDRTLLVGTDPAYLFPTADEAHAMGEDLGKAAQDLERGGGVPPTEHAA